MVLIKARNFAHDSGVKLSPICPQCEKETFPFYDASLLSSCSSLSALSKSNPTQFPSTPSFSILSFNARSLLPKIDNLRAVCSCSCYDFITVTETWLSADVLDHELYIPGYTLIRRDRNRHGGGVAIYVSTSVSFRSLVFPCPNLKLIVLEFTLKSQLYTLGVFYRPPSASTDCLSNLYNHVNSMHHQNRSNLILCGDFNIDVSSASAPTCASNNLFNQLCTDFCLSQVISQPTRVTSTSSTTIDLVLLSSPESLISSNVLSPIGTSDHNSISIKLKLPSGYCASERPTRSIWLYGKTNICLGKQLLSTLPIIKESEDIDEFWKCWSTHFMSVMQKCIPKLIVPVDRPNPWIDRDIQHDIRLRERLYKRFKASKCQDWLVKYKAVRNRVVSKTRSAKQAFFQSLCSSRNSPKKFWSAMRSLKPNKSPLSTALSAGSITATSALDKANLLNSFFASCFNPGDACPSYDPVIVPKILPDNLDITRNEVRELLRRTHSHSAPGPDLITAWTLHSQSAPHLFHWLSNYLSMRLQRVVLSGAESLWLPVKSGVLQGSILGPLLFLVFLNDIFSVQLSEWSSLLVYADDILLFKSLSSPSDLAVFEHDVDLISDWISSNYLTANVEKSKCMLISRSRLHRLNFVIY